jgi:hypothetical protein
MVAIPNNAIADMTIPIFVWFIIAALSLTYFYIRTPLQQNFNKVVQQC